MPRTTLLRHKVEPTGTVSPFAGAVAPEGWVFANGATLQIADYPKLFAIIGDLYGGDGVTTFAVPEYNGRTAVGKDDMGGVVAGRITSGGSGIDGETLGAAGGDQTHAISTSQMPLHGHRYITSSDTEGNSSGGLMAGNQLTIGTASAYTGTPTTSPTRSIGGTGNNYRHQNTQPSIICNYIIKVV